MLVKWIRKEMVSYIEFALVEDDEEPDFAPFTEGEIAVFIKANRRKIKAAAVDTYLSFEAEFGGEPDWDSARDWPSDWIIEGLLEFVTLPRKRAHASEAA